MEKTRNFNRGYIEKLGKDSDKANGSLQIRVKSVTTRNAAGHDLLEISGYGYYDKRSGIEYALGQGILNSETGAATVRATAWDQKVEYIKRFNIKEGDTIRIYGAFKRNEYVSRDNVKRASIDVTLHAVEIDFRNKNAANTDAAAAAAPVAPAPMPEHYDEPVLEEDYGFGFAMPEGIDVPDLPFS